MRASTRPRAELCEPNRARKATIIDAAQTLGPRPGQFAVIASRAVGYWCDLRQRGAEDATGGSGLSRRTPTGLPCS